MATSPARRDDPTEVYNWRRVSERLTTSGQPTERQLALIADLGVTHVVNLGLHTHDRALADEAGSVRALDMTYVHIPVNFDKPLERDMATFNEVMSELSRAVLHVHCIANLRVSAFLYRHNRDQLGMPEAFARAELERVWRPGGAWAVFIGDEARADQAHQYAGRDY